MANYTTNYNLKKPLGSEYYDIEDANGNADLIDAALKEYEKQHTVNYGAFLEVDCLKAAIILSMQHRIIFYNDVLYYLGKPIVTYVE